MKTWRDKKQEIRTKLGNERSNRIEAIAQIVNRMYERRLELGWTQEQLAAKVGCRQEQIARIENGATIPRLDTLIDVAQALGLNVHLQGIEEAAAAAANV